MPKSIFFAPPASCLDRRRGFVQHPLEVSKIRDAFGDQGLKLEGLFAARPAELERVMVHVKAMMEAREPLQASIFSLLKQKESEQVADRQPRLGFSLRTSGQLLKAASSPQTGCLELPPGPGEYALVSTTVLRGLGIQTHFSFMHYACDSGTGAVPGALAIIEGSLMPLFFIPAPLGRLMANRAPVAIEVIADGAVVHWFGIKSALERSSHLIECADAGTESLPFLLSDAANAGHIFFESAFAGWPRPDAHGPSPQDGISSPHPIESARIGLETDLWLLWLENLKDRDSSRFNLKWKVWNALQAHTHDRNDCQEMKMKS